MVKKYVKKPVEIEALLYDGFNISEVKEFIGESCQIDIYDSAWEVGHGPAIANVTIHTLEGDMHVSIGDFIIKGVQGEFYPCKPDIFEQTYQEVK